MDITITKSKNKEKKLDAIINSKKENRIQTDSLGASVYSDYTKHKDPDREQRYIDRHSEGDWTKSNIKSPAFMSRWLLWKQANA